MQRRNAFTLIELLVIIAIIAILTAILFPVFAQAREKARAVSCLSNMKQIGTALVMYVQDYDESFPRGWYYEANNQPTTWRTVCNRYIKNGFEQVGENNEKVMAGGLWHRPARLRIRLTVLADMAGSLFRQHFRTVRFSPAWRKRKLPRLRMSLLPRKSGWTPTVPVLPRASRRTGGRGEAR